MLKQKNKFRKEIFNRYNLFGKLVYLFSMITKIKIELRDIYLKGKFFCELKGILAGHRPSDFDNKIGKYTKNR